MPGLDRGLNLEGLSARQIELVLNLQGVTSNREIMDTVKKYQELTKKPLIPFRLFSKKKTSMGEVEKLVQTISQNPELESIALFYNFQKVNGEFETIERFYDHSSKKATPKMIADHVVSSISRYAKDRNKFVKGLKKETEIESSKE